MARAATAWFGRFSSNHPALPVATFAADKAALEKLMTEFSMVKVDFAYDVKISSKPVRGVYKSTDAGATWTHVGLTNVGNIGGVIIHPTDPNTAFVAAIGNPFARNSERGLLLTGEIIQPTGDWFVTAAGRVLVRFQPDVAPDLESDDALDEALKRFGSWASHILWDHCRGVLLQASSSFPFEFSLPTITPRPVLVTKAMQREAEAPDPD